MINKSAIVKDFRQFDSLIDAMLDKRRHGATLADCYAYMQLAMKAMAVPQCHIEIVSSGIWADFANIANFRATFISTDF